MDYMNNIQNYVNENINAKREKRISIVISLAFLFNSICLLTNTLFPSVSNFGEMFVFALLLIGALICITSVMTINTTLLLINGTILIAMLLSFAFYDSNSDIKTLFINFIAWGIGITVIMMQKYVIRKVMDISFWMSVLIIAVDIITFAHERYESMTWTYAIFPCLAISIIHFNYCRFSKGYLKLAYIPGLILLIKFVFTANRGGLISLMVLLFLISIKSISKNSKHLKSHRMLAVVMLLIGVLIIVNLEPIVEYLYLALESRNIEISALSKMRRLIESDNLINNRDELYVFAWEGFLASPLWGNGIGAFSVNHGGWAHNFILQLLYEGGILLSSLILIPMIDSFLFVFRDNRIAGDEYSFFVLLFTTSVPRLLFSTELWNTQTFWMLFAFCIIIRYKYSEKRGMQI